MVFKYIITIVKKKTIVFFTLILFQLKFISFQVTKIFFMVLVYYIDPVVNHLYIFSLRNM